MKPRKKLKNTPQSTNIQNNLEINLIPDVFNSITNLEKQNPELAKKALELIEYDLKESHKEKQTILELEKQEQTLRKNELPHLRKYIFLGQKLSFFVFIGGSVLSAYFGYLEMEKAAIAALVIPIGTLAVNLLNLKTQ
jgi:hypothetical protein